MKLNNSLDLDEFIHGSMMLQGGLRGAAASALHLQRCFLLEVCTGACTTWLWRCSFLAMGLQTEKITCHQLSPRAARWVGTQGKTRSEPPTSDGEKGVTIRLWTPQNRF